MVKIIIFVAGINLLWEPTAAQLTVTQGSDMGLTAEQLVRDHLVGKGVSMFNVTVNGSGGIISKNNIGYFNATGGAFTQLNMKGGIIMTTGKADFAIGPNDKPSLGFRSNTGSDPDLEQLTGTISNDACIVEFDFIPQCDTLRFRYAFGSEEFREFCGHINDAFGFFLSGPGIHGVFSNNSINIAHMPGSSEYVTINNICADPSSAWDN
ncbi:MAG TPA: choice-of-anchor L domain-containing protein, partial [Bacteroidales bacterium]|nr:choice-of-anchor L domain-containing protein [Bacteroidales bacterium]